MTTAIVHGDPGSRKTATLVGQYGVPALYAGRTVVSNIRGFNSLEKVEKVYGKKLPPEAKLISQPFTKTGFRKMASFFQWAPPGALILMDEGQRIYPTRLKNLSMYDAEEPRLTGFQDEQTGEPEIITTVEEAFDCHRHMNWDIYISTTNIEKVHKEIRQVAEYGYRQKDLATVMPILAVLLGDIKRVKHNAENKGNSESQSMSSTNHRIDKKVFQVYQSTATGVAKASATKSSLLSQPKLLCLLLFVGYSIYNFGGNLLTYGTLLPNSGQIAAHDAKLAAGKTDSQTDIQTASLPVRGDNRAPANVPSRDVPNRKFDSPTSLELFKDLYSWTATISTDGRITHYFDLKRGEQYTNVTSEDLELFEITIIPRRDFIILKYGEHSKIVHSVRHKYVEEHAKNDDPLIFGETI